jgi:anthranilate synthase/aminodeoxychorismate synthase-like glutamine amidotransferase
LDIILIDHYDSFSGNIQNWLENAGFRVEVFAYDSPIIRSLPLDRPVVIGPGPKAPQDAAQSIEFCLRAQGKVSLLGICLGHQILSHLAGLSIVKSLDPHHGSTRTVTPHRDSILLKGIQRGFKAATYNSLKAEGSLPSPWIVNAVNEFGEIEGIERQDQKGVFGLQFHPESFLSEYGFEIARNWLQFLKSKEDR